MRKAIWTLLCVLGTAVLALPAERASAHRVPIPCDFTTGGGFVFADNGERVNFGLVGGCKNGGFFGHVNIVDRGVTGTFITSGNALHIDSITVDAYFDSMTPFPSPYRDICGTARTNTIFGDVKYRVRTRDNGEPGGSDRFGYKITGSFGTFVRSTRELGPPGEKGGGGNIQLHKPNPSTTGPAVDPDEITACGSDDSGLGP
jgi:hypothetical protein